MTIYITYYEKSSSQKKVIASFKRYYIQELNAMGHPVKMSDVKDIWIGDLVRACNIATRMTVEEKYEMMEKLRQEMYDDIYNTLGIYGR